MKKYPFLSLIAAVVQCSCTHYYYVANVQNVPMLQEKNDLQVSGFFGGWDESKCIELQTAFAPAENFGVLANFMTAWGGNVSERDYGKGSCFDLGMGYFKPVNETLIFEIYSGIGGGSQIHEFEELSYNPGTGGIDSHYAGSARLSSSRFFIQPSLGIKSEGFEAAVSFRASRLSYPGVTNSYYDEELGHIGDKPHYFIEPALTLRAVWNNIKLQGQISYTEYISSPRQYFYEEAHLSGGIIFIIPVKKTVLVPGE